MWEIPRLKRCCYCVPLQTDILNFAYLNLVISTITCFVQWFMWSLSEYSPGIYRGLILIDGDNIALIAFIFDVLDLIFVIVLIFGAHMKNIILMKIYYYYLIPTMIGGFVAMLATYDNYDWSLDHVLIFVSLGILGTANQIYLLLLLHSELKKSRYQEGMTSFVNETSEVYLVPETEDKKNFV